MEDVGLKLSARVISSRQICLANEIDQIGPCMRTASTPAGRGEAVQHGLRRSTQRRSQGDLQSAPASFGKSCAPILVGQLRGLTISHYSVAFDRR